jgi:hypothetical protein
MFKIHTIMKHSKVKPIPAQLFFQLIASIVLISGCEPSQQGQQPVAEHEPQHTIEMTPAAPITNSEYLLLYQLGKITYKLERLGVPGQYYEPYTNEPSIPIGDFQNFYRNTRQGVFQGVRIRPGLIGEQLVFILSQSDSMNRESTDYYLLTQGRYLPGEFAATIITQDSARILSQQYLNNVKIYFNSQTDPGSPMANKIRKSRFYHSSILDNYISQNLPSPTDDIPDPISVSRIKLTLGYISSELVGSIQGRNPGESFSDAELQGFTVMMHLIDSTGNIKYIEETKNYRQSMPVDYQGLYLEVGTPCPPRCPSVF